MGWVLIDQARAFKWRGAYAGGTSYALGDAVSNAGGSYVSITSANLGNTPSTDGGVHWALIAAQGSTGSTGAPGTTLWSGLTGTPPALTIFSGSLPESTITGLVTDLAAKVGTSDSRLTDARTPTAHAPSHKSGGSDAIKLDELAAPTDVTTLNVSTTAHGLTPKAPADATKVLRGDAAFGTLAYSSLSAIPSTFTPSAHVHPESDVTNLVTDLAAKAPTSRTIIAGSGLTGGGDLSADRTLAVDGTVGRTGGTSHYYDYDEFVNLPKWTSPSTSGGTGGISANWAADQGNGRHGIWQLCPGSVASNWAKLAFSPIFLKASTVIWRAQVSQTGATAGTGIQSFVGLTNFSGPVIDTAHYYIGFYYNPSTFVNWRAYCRSLTTVTDQDTGVAVNPNTGTYHDLKIVATASSVAFWVNGTLTNTITTTIPSATTALNPSVSMNSGSSTSSFSLFVDSLEIDIDTGIAGKFMKALI